MVFISNPPQKISDKMGQSINDHLLELDVVGATAGIILPMFGGWTSFGIWFFYTS
jgi:hypothetical protein